MQSIWQHVQFRPKPGTACIKRRARIQSNIVINVDSLNNVCVGYPEHEHLVRVASANIVLWCLSKFAVVHLYTHDKRDVDFIYQIAISNRWSPYISSICTYCDPKPNNAIFAGNDNPANYYLFYYLPYYNKNYALIKFTWWAYKHLP